MRTPAPAHAGMKKPAGAVAAADGSGDELGSAEGDGVGSAEGLGDGLGSGSGEPTITTPHIPSRGPPWY